MYTLLFTNDFHNHLNTAQADYLRRMRLALGPRGLMLDAGDAVGSGNITFRPGGEPILNTLSDIGYDAMTVGNREFHISQIGFNSKTALARFPVLCANIHRQTANMTRQEQAEGIDRQRLPTQSYFMRDFLLSAGHTGQTDNPVSKAYFRVVIIGLTVPMVTTRMAARKISAYVFDDPIATASELVPRLRAEHKPDLMVALTHIGIAQDRKLAQSMSGIDLIIGGHTHVVLEQGERVGSTLIAQAGSHGRFVGRVDVEVDVEAAMGLSERPRLTASLSPLPKEPSEAFVQEQIRLLDVRPPASGSNITPA